ncbi:aspartyl protease family protein [Pinibacter soli]|uniref:Aspartyl protease family protein n=1 Tax=Pinibacter soli TaxID=3044211 RepID=A0ABT6RB54_9BACT|nr:aspartyl protease family protein [Pinibacter soli]MDI3319796.1 aspartyl protease family protein [Pinibacter soli]
MLVHLFRRKMFLLLFVALAVLTSVGSAQKTFIPDSLVSALNRSFQTRDASVYRLFLASDFSVGVYSRPSAEGVLQNIAEHFSLDSLRLKTMVTSGEKKRMVLQGFSEGKSIETAAWLNDRNELLYVDLFDQLCGVDKYQRSILKARIPFQMVNGFIVVTARLNQSSRPLRLMFDTGADGMALKKSVADSLGLVKSRRQNTSVVGASMEVSISSDNTLHLDTLTIPKNNIALFESIGGGLDGILGNTLARRFITKVDFDKMVIELYNFGNYAFEKEGTTVAVRLANGVPVVPGILKVGTQEAGADFVFDTGAGYYLVGFGPFVENHQLLTSGFLPYSSGTTVSLGHASTSVTGDFDKLNLGSLELKHFPGVLQVYETGDEKWAGDRAGSLGIKMLHRFNFTLDLGRQLVHFTPNKASGLPYDFVLNGVYFTFNEKEQLVVESVTNENMAQKILRGDVVVSINNLEAAQLVTNPEKINLLLSAPEKGYTLQLQRRDSVQSLQL